LYVSSEKSGYGSKAWNFPSLESRSGFEDAVEALEQRGSVEVFQPEQVSEQDLKYGDGLSYALEKIDEHLDGNFEFVRSYRVESPAKTPVSRNPKGFLASVARPEVAGQVYIVDSVKGAAVLGDQPVVEYVSEKVKADKEPLVDRILEP
jgi:hypothetical protein